MKHAMNYEGGKVSRDKYANEEGRVVRRTATVIALVGLALGGAAVVVESQDEEPKAEKPYVDTNRDCRPKGFQEVPYNIQSGKLNFLVRQIETVEHKGPLDKNPCYDEALEIVKQQTDESYPYHGSVILPKFLIPEDMTLRQIKAQ